jgi:hypothetical protein
MRESERAVFALLIFGMSVGSAISAELPQAFLGGWTADPCRGSAGDYATFTITPKTVSFGGKEEDGFRCRLISIQPKGNSFVVNMNCDGEGATSKTTEIWHLHATGDGPSFNQLITVDPKGSRVTVLHHCHG